MDRPHCCAVAAYLFLALTALAPPAPLAEAACPLDDPATEPADRRAWQALRRGGAADFSQAQPSGTGALGAGFLQTLFGDEACRAELPTNGIVYLVGAEFAERVTLANLDLDHGLVITGATFRQGLSVTDTGFGRNVHIVHSTFGDGLELKRIRSEGELDLQGNAVSGAVDVYSVLVRHHLDLSNVAAAGDLLLTNIEVGQNLYLGNSRAEAIAFNGSRIGDSVFLDGDRVAVQKRTAMSHLRVGGSLFLSAGQFGEVDLSDAQIGVNLELRGRGSTIRDALLAPRVRIGRSLILSEAFLNAVKLDEASVGGNLEIARNALFTAPLSLRGIRVDSRVRIRELTVGGLDLSGARIGLELDVAAIGLLSPAAALDLSYLDAETVQLADAGRPLPSIDLRGARIRQALLVGNARWQAQSLLRLADASAQLVDDAGACLSGRDPAIWRVERAERWPHRLELAGFRYEQFSCESDRGAAWWSAWLARDRSASPQPERQLADTLRAHGQEALADEVLFQMKKRGLPPFDGGTVPIERLPSLLPAYLHLVLIGFGHRLHWALYWTLLFVALGATLASKRFTAQGVAPLEPWTWPERFAYSLHTLLPVINLDHERYRQVDPAWGRVRYYFYLHRLAGWVLAGFLAAGLAGLAA